MTLTVEPTPGEAAHLDLRVGRLVLERRGDLPAQRVGRAAGGRDQADVGHVDAALLVDLDLVERGDLLADAGEQAGVDVFPDRDRDPVAGA